MASFVAFVIMLSITNPGIAAPIRCKTVEKSAVTYYHSETTASRTEENKNCTISIGNASEESAIPQIAYIIFQCTSIMNNEIYTSRNRIAKFVDILFPVIVSGSIPDIDIEVEYFDFSPPINKNNCRKLFSDLDDNKISFSSAIHEEVQEISEPITECLASGFMSQVECLKRDDVVTVTFESQFGNHSVFLPQGG